MRPFILPLLTLTGVILLCQYGCSDPDTTARGIAHKYLEARLQGDFSEAAKYVSEDSKDLFEELEDMAFEYADQPPVKIVHLIRDVKESGKSAEVSYNIEGYGEEKLSMIKDGGEWKVLLSPQSVPDAGLLVLELKALEKEDSTDIDKETLDQILINEGAEVAEWSDSADID
ncbi:MAG: hypothetical protein R3D00_21650 [Bacteroidia bacterium]